MNVWGEGRNEGMKVLTVNAKRVKSRFKGVETQVFRENVLWCGRKVVSLQRERESNI